MLGGLIMNIVVETIMSRKGTTEYMPEQIKEEDLETILAAGRAAPNAYNAQEWHFTVVQNKCLLKRIDKATFEALNRIGEIGDDEKDYKPLYNAPTLIILSASKESLYGKQNCSCASQNMAIAAKSLGIGSRFLDVPNMIFRDDTGAEFLKDCMIPDGFETICQLVLGYPIKKDEKPNTRKVDVVTYIR